MRGQFINYTGMGQVGEARDMLYHVRSDADEQGQPCLKIEYPIPFILTYCPKIPETFFAMEQETEITFIKNKQGAVDHIQIDLGDDFMVTAYRRTDRCE